MEGVPTAQLPHMGTTLYVVFSRSDPASWLGPKNGPKAWAPLPMQIWARQGRWLESLGPTVQGNPAEASGSQFLLSPPLVVVAIWGVSQWVPCLCLHSLFPLHSSFKQNKTNPPSKIFFFCPIHS